jgi:shikimate dehydrogenase
VRVSGKTTVFALLGDPVAHSLSPHMHNAAFTALGLDAVYVALRCSESDLPGLMRAVVSAGGGGNVTVPHKAAAARAVRTLLGPLPGTCNTYWGRDGDLVGCTTDVQGVLQALDRLDASGRDWLIVGTGGSARAVLAAARERAARVAVRSRAAARAAAFLQEAEAMNLSRCSASDADVIINATPLGLEADDPLPVTPFETPRARWVLDLVYAPGATPFVRCYAERGVVAADGRDVLIAQGAAALECWFPGVRAPVEVMRAAVRAELG